MVERMKQLADPPPPDAQETTRPWNVRETILDIGHSAALRLENWDLALELNGAIAASKQKRGAPRFEQALTRSSDYGPLLNLGVTRRRARFSIGARRWPSKQVA